MVRACRPARWCSARFRAAASASRRARLSVSMLPGFRGRGALIDHDLLFDGSTVSGPTSLQRASIKGQLSCAGATLRCSGGKFAPGGEGAIAVRQHVIRLWASKPDSMENVLPGTVMRQTFLGSSRDYQVAVSNGTQLRVVASAAENIPPGAPVWLYLPPDRCRVLSA